ncbi:centromere protein V [Protopterus annectens]|uniref:centromere protein V n=1 Tax=Protopterus annectens TaxID=7888 RepID=UPI001CFAC9AD|nr:centromere protein V [Protopterus annectens]
MPKQKRATSRSTVNAKSRRIPAKAGVTRLRQPTSCRAGAQGKTQTKEETQSVPPREDKSPEHQDLIKYTGGCHCGAVRFEVWASKSLHVFDCNCSICTKKQNRHFIVPASRFHLLKGAESLTTYTFQTRMAKHTFCKICGVQSFYTPRSNPDGYGVAPHCLDKGEEEPVITLEYFNGNEWESSMAQHKTIKDMSKL